VTSTGSGWASVVDPMNRALVVSDRYDGGAGCTGESGAPTGPSVNVEATAVAWSAGHGGVGPTYGTRMLPPCCGSFMSTHCGRTPQYEPNQPKPHAALPSAETLFEYGLAAGLMRSARPRGTASR
jgi:hypothetical protein